MRIAHFAYPGVQFHGPGFDSTIKVTPITNLSIEITLTKLQSILIWNLLTQSLMTLMCMKHRVTLWYETVADHLL